MGNTCVICRNYDAATGRCDVSGEPTKPTSTCDRYVRWPPAPGATDPERLTDERLSELCEEGEPIERAEVLSMVAEIRASRVEPPPNHWRKRFEDLETHRASCCDRNAEDVARLREALAGVIEVADGDHCACGNPGCTETREAWAAARAALAATEETP